jgi:hypothetical protein
MQNMPLNCRTAPHIISSESGDASTEQPLQLNYYHLNLYSFWTTKVHIHRGVCQIYLIIYVGNLPGCTEGYQLTQTATFDIGAYDLQASHSE